MARKKRKPFEGVTQVIDSGSLPDNQAIFLRDEGQEKENLSRRRNTMAKRKSMGFDDALKVILSPDNDNPYRDMLQLITQYALEMEMNAHLGAEAYERSENRKGKEWPQAACVHHQGRGPRTVGSARPGRHFFHRTVRALPQEAKKRCA